jgi:cyclophilin family peptidyl-prolyl cis-trans isomerase
VRAAALRGLQRRGSPADLEVLLRAYERAQRDTQRTAIMAAVDALGELARHNVPVQRSFFLRFHKPADPIVRQRIADRIGNGEWGPLRPIDTQQPPEHYRAIARRFWPPDSVDARPRVRIRTAPGEIVLELNPREAPLTVLNFLSLAERGYFNNGRWHRVVPNFVLQDGDPRGDGSGGPGTVIRDEINRLRYLRGALGMALSGPDTGGSQFFITHSPQPHLDGGYTIFGRVIEGMDIADRVVQDDPIISIEVVR